MASNSDKLAVAVVFVDEVRGLGVQLSVYSEDGGETPVATLSPSAAHQLQVALFQATLRIAESRARGNGGFHSVH